MSWAEDRARAAALALLGLDPGASSAQVVTAWRRLAREVHPDRSDAPGAAARFAELRAAYELALATVKDPLKDTAQEPATDAAKEPAAGPADDPAGRAGSAPRGAVPGAQAPIVAGPVVVRPWPWRSR